MKLAHLTSREAFEKLAKAKASLKQAKKDKKDAATIKSLQKAVNDAQAVANLF
jgi:hypothetical protein